LIQDESQRSITAAAATALRTSTQANRLNGQYPAKHGLAGKRSVHLYTTAYRETRTAAVYTAKWHTDQH